MANDNLKRNCKICVHGSNTRICRSWRRENILVISMYMNGCYSEEDDETSAPGDRLEVQVWWREIVTVIKY